MAGIAENPPAGTRKLRVVAYAEYEARPGDYGTDDPVAMAAIDTVNFRAESGNLGVFFDDVEVVVMPILSEAECRPH